ncbi:MAG: histidine kinase, partial [Gammaproteobacteria bacterium]|nr:histidine kinase [Gammaproteobacteria bacterium]
MMGRITGLSKSRLALWLGVFFIALAIPSGLLISQAYDQLKWEAFHRHRLMAEEFVARLDQYFGDLVASQNSLAFTDFQFLNIASDGRSGRYQPSSLSKFPVEGEIPGTLGYFQVDNEGRFSTPLVSVGGYSHDLGVSQEEARARMTLHQQLFEWLHDNQLVEGKPGQTNIERAGLESSPAQEESAPAPLAATIQSSRSEGLVSQKAFDRLKETADNRYSPAGKIEKKFESGPYASDSDLGRVEDLPLEAVYEEKLSKVEENKSIGVLSDDAGFSGKPIVRREQNAVIESENERMEDIQNAITIFESEIEPFDLARLGTGHFLLYRKVWREDERYIQGMLIDPQELLSVVVGEAFSRSPVANASELTVAFDGAVLSGFGTLGGYGHSGSDEAISGMLLLKTSLSAPLNNLQLIFSLVSLPAGEAARLLAWTTLILLLVLSGGLVLMYRLGVRQINLVEQQQDFVSAVSHELKTPLTSIRMYGEMLREGWVDESKRNGYYDFIFDESERLTRLINNVLALARMTRSEPAPDLRS